MMHDCHNHDERWAGVRARREARREAWRAQREARREAWRAHWRDMGAWTGMGDPGAGPDGVDALKAQVETMRKTIDRLGERIIVLEKLAVSSDDARLAAEIEKLRDRDEQQ
jgi:hypothetical protein